MVGGCVLCCYEGDGGNEQEVGGGKTDVDDAAPDAHESAAGAAHGAH